MAQTKVKEGLIDAVLGGGLTLISTPKTAGFTAVAGESYLVDTSSSAITVALPGSPSVGDEIGILDYSSNAATNNITIDPGTLNLRGATDDLVISANNQSTRLIYSGATKGWLLKSGAAAAPIPALTVDYLVVAGGGGGGCANGGGGGGGAGGYLTNYGGIAVSLSTSTDYVLTIGGGGNGGATTSNGQPGVVGSNSVFNLITSLGGGYGGGDVSQPGGTGGSGGGGARGSGSSGGSGTSSPQQGYSGGTGYGNTGGGGGGAGNAGANATSLRGGNGGIGITNAITVAAGSGPYYAGGGGGGMESPSSASDAGSGGSGGGGTGGAAGGVGSAPTTGTPNTGGGGGGSGDYNTGGNYSGQNGGSGVIILRYPDAYTIAETTSSQLTFTTDSTTVADTKITTFTGGNGTIEFTT